MDRRGFLKGILASGVAPAFVGASVLMPVKKLWTPTISLHTAFSSADVWVVLNGLEVFVPAHTLQVFAHDGSGHLSLRSHKGEFHVRFDPPIKASGGYEISTVGKFMNTHYFGHES